MKSPILCLVSIAVLSQGLPAHAEGIFAQAFQNRLTGTAADEAKASEIGPTLMLSRLDEANRADAENADAGVVPVGHGCADAYCDNGCCNGSGFGNGGYGYGYGNGGGNVAWYDRKVAPGTGAYGEDSLYFAQLGFNQDAFFGFYPTLTAYFAINEVVDFAFYSILWTTDFFSQGPGGLNGPVGIDSVGLWTEFGTGLNFKGMEGALNVTTQVGVLNGALLSGITGATPPKAFEGVVPNITVDYDGTFFESNFYMGYYVATRGRRENQADFLHWWYNAGIKPWGDNQDWKSIISTGLHYENLRRTDPGNEGNLYGWLGPYVQYELPNGMIARFTGGWDVDRQNFGENFYKVNLTYEF